MPLKVTMLSKECFKRKGDYSFGITKCKLRITKCKLRITDYELRNADSRLRIADFGLWNTDYELRNRNYGLRIATLSPFQKLLSTKKALKGRDLITVGEAH
jgi:hypothetical protein